VVMSLNGTTLNLPVRGKIGRHLYFAL